MKDRKVKTLCPGCGAAMFAMGVEVKQDGVSKLHAEPSPWATFRREEFIDLVCANGCEVTVKRESRGEQTASELGATPLLPLTEDARRAFGAIESDARQRKEKR